MLTKDDMDTLFKTMSIQDASNHKYSEQYRMEALRAVISKVDANDPQIPKKRNGEYGPWTGGDVATIIFRFAAMLKDKNNFNTVMEELKKRGIPDKTFGDAFMIMQREERLFVPEYRKKVMEMANGQYSPELFTKLHENDLYKSSDPWFLNAVNHFDITFLQQQGVDFEDILATDTSKDSIANNKVKQISSKDGKHFAVIGLMDLPRLQNKIKEFKMKAGTQKVTQMQTANNRLVQDIQTER